MCSCSTSARTQNQLFPSPTSSDRGSTYIGHTHTHCPHAFLLGFITIEILETPPLCTLKSSALCEFASVLQTHTEKKVKD